MQIVILLVYVVAIGAMMYFLAIKPQKKQQKQQQELMDSIEKGQIKVNIIPRLAQKPIKAQTLRRII